MMQLAPLPPCRCPRMAHRVMWSQPIERPGWLCVYRFCTYCWRDPHPLWFREPSWMHGRCYVDVPTVSWPYWRRLYRHWMTGA